MMAWCRIATRELRSESAFVSCALSATYRRRNSRNWQNCRNYVGGIERGERNVGLLNIVKLAHGLNVRPAKLIESVR